MFCRFMESFIFDNYFENQRIMSLTVYSDSYRCHCTPGRVVFLARDIISRHGKVISQEISAERTVLAAALSYGAARLGRLTVSIEIEIEQAGSSRAEVAIRGEWEGLFPGRAGSAKALKSFALELYDALERERVPEAGQEVYVDSSVYVDFPEQDFIGGLATISAVTEDGKTIEVLEDPGGSFRWERLAAMQAELRERFGSSRAHRCHE
jgi:hypothetical protein